MRLDTADARAIEIIHDSCHRRNGCGTLLVEFRTTMDRWLTVPRPAMSIGGSHTQPRSVVAEVPFARADELHKIYDGSTCSTARGIGNRSSTATAASFLRASWNSPEQTASFPDDRSIALKHEGSISS
jgi:hypothetical protein